MQEWAGLFCFHICWGLFAKSIPFEAMQVSTEINIAEIKFKVFIQKNAKQSKPAILDKQNMHTFVSMRCIRNVSPLKWQQLGENNLAYVTDEYSSWCSMMF